jgi:hypothetical protein
MVVRQRGDCAHLFANAAEGAGGGVFPDETLNALLSLADKDITDVGRKND